MFSKTVLVLAMLCVANASVIMVNVFDDNPDTEVANELLDCNLRACEQLCHRLRFPSGTCINGRCKCDNFLNTDNLDTEVANEPRACNFRACDQFCRRLGFPSGTCINGRCKCDNFLNADNLDTEIANEPQDCNFRACDQLCRRLGFPSGTCINGRCKCDNFLNAASSSIINAFSGKGEESNRISMSTKDLNSSTTRSCNPRDCDLKCKHRGKTGGFCTDNKCFCY